MKYYDEVVIEFEEAIDHNIPAPMIFGYVIKPSEILRELRPDEYEKELLRWIDDNFHRNTYKNEVYYDRML